MATIVKTVSATRVKYSIIRVVDGEVRTEAQPDAVFSGVQAEDKVKRMLTKRLGKDVMFAITNIDAGQHRYVMNFETFIRNATIEDTKDADEKAEEDPGEETEAEEADAAEPESEDEGSDDSEDE